MLEHVVVGGVEELFLASRKAWSRALFDFLLSEVEFTMKPPRWRLYGGPGDRAARAAPAGPTTPRPFPGSCSVGLGTTACEGMALPGAAERTRRENIPAAFALAALARSAENGSLAASLGDGHIDNEKGRARTALRTLF